MRILTPIILFQPCHLCGIMPINSFRLKWPLASIGTWFAFVACIKHRKVHNIKNLLLWLPPRMAKVKSSKIKMLAELPTDIAFIGKVMISNIIVFWLTSKQDIWIRDLVGNIYVKLWSPKTSIGDIEKKRS